MAITLCECIKGRQFRDVVERHGRVRGKAQVRVVVVGVRVGSDRLEHEWAGSLKEGELDGDDGLAIRFEVAGAIAVYRLLDCRLITDRLSWIAVPSSVWGGDDLVCRRCRYEARHAEDQC